MDNKIIAAIIAGIFALVSPIVTLFVKRLLDERSFRPISKSRRQALIGNWKGIGKQDEGPDGIPIEFPIDLDIAAGNRIVTGVFSTHLQTPQGSSIGIFELNGGFLYDKYLRLNYTAKDTSRIHFGAFVLELGSKGRTLAGKLVGYGADSEKIVFGTIEAKKIVS